MKVVLVMSGGSSGGGSGLGWFGETAQVDALGMWCILRVSMGLMG